MRINNLVSPYHLQCLVRDHYDSLNEIEQKFLVNMLVLLDTNGNISQKQALWLESLIAKMKKIAVLKQRSRRKKPNHDDHEVEVRPGSGPHAARLWCVKCNKHIQWITRDQDRLLSKT